jgi:hypothetical protein
MVEVLRVLKETGNTETVQAKMMGFRDRFEILGLSRYRNLEAKWTS